MLQLDNPCRPLDRHLLDAKGGFAWWYADVLDEQGSGLVCIWSFGLPFLPGDRAARLAGRPPRAGDRPSLNLAVYDRGRPAFYSLLELATDEARWDDRDWRFGASTFRFDDLGTGRVLTARLDLPVPGTTERLRGSFTVEGPATLPVDSTDAPLEHAWTPLLGPSTATAHLRVGDHALLDCVGSGYHDRNGSQTALDELGIDRWTWGRQILDGHLVVHYLTWPSADADPVFVVTIVDPQGQITTHDVPAPRCLEPRRTAMGMRWHRRVEVDLLGDVLAVTYEPPVDAGPFYLRAQTRSRWRGHEASGWAELCEPSRIDLDRHRFLVNMAVHRAHGPNSMWLPLFVGSRHDRLRRLWQHWHGVAGVAP